MCHLTGYFYVNLVFCWFFFLFLIINFFSFCLCSLLVFEKITHYVEQDVTTCILRMIYVGLFLSSSLASKSSFLGVLYSVADGERGWLYSW